MPATEGLVMKRCELYIRTPLVSCERTTTDVLACHFQIKRSDAYWRGVGRGR